jgi:E3 ubiquitin-protein ligase CHFR
MSHRPEPSVSESIVNFVDELAQELQCGCCSELVYKPVLVMPCQHFFCGRYGSTWSRNLKCILTDNMSLAVVFFGFV